MQAAAVVPVVGWWWSQLSLPPLHLMFDSPLGSLDMDTALLGIQMSRVGLGMPGEEEASRRSWSTFQDLKEIYRRAGEGLLARP